MEIGALPRKIWDLDPRQAAQVAEHVNIAIGLVMYDHTLSCYHIKSYQIMKYINMILQLCIYNYIYYDDHTILKLVNLFQNIPELWLFGLVLLWVVGMEVTQCEAVWDP